MIVALQTLIFFRESLLTVLERLIGPYYKRFSFSLINKNSNSDDEDSDEQVFAEYDDEKGVVFFPPMYAQRYAAVNDCLLDERWCGKLEKIVDLGYHDMTFIKYLKEVPGVKHILGVDIENVSLRCSPDLIAQGEYAPIRETPLQITLFEGNAADPDYRLIGCDAVVAIEMIEHMLPHDLDRLVHNIFGFIQPQVAIITTPNSDFNVLFKSMEKNGLRRWDHLFEWSREQFHDWCSNIVVRYPKYTVTCKGVGPGPSGTLHLGCCSQLALFVSKNYQKQQSLTIDSMALVKSLPNETSLSDIEGSWGYTDSVHERNMLCAPPIVESFSELPFPEKRSCMTIVIMTSGSLDTLVYRDNTAQCNIDKEIGRSYLMFDEDAADNVLVARRRVVNRVYEIEDVSSRLNCSMLQVRKFSKITQNLMAKNKIDSIMHTREIVDEIRQLTKTLNFDKNTSDQQPKMYIWNNINWGNNAPYWNQYYKVVRDYNYPFETKSEECRIVELISDEINTLIDSQCSPECSYGGEKLEIPIDYLMGVVKHITNDVDKVKDLLEWNGYEVADNIVIHSRLIVENVSMTTPDIECQDDILSDWDVTDIHSTSYSNASTISSQLNGKWLHRSLDLKVRKLRTLLTADEDITTELDHVVCRLMKLAIKTSRNRNVAPSASWLQFKLLDLLTLTERAIQRRKKHFYDKNPLAALIASDYQDDKTIHTLESSKKNDSDTANDIVDKYSNFVNTSDDKDYYNTSVEAYQYVHLEIEDDISVTSNEFIQIYDHKREENSSTPSSDIFKSIKLKSMERNISPTRLCLLPDNYSSSGDTDRSIKLSRCKKTNRKSKKETNNDRHKMTPIIKNMISNDNDTTSNERHGSNIDKKKFFQRIIRKKSFYRYILNKNVASVECKHYKIGFKRKIRQHRHLRSLPKPIPNSLVDLCQQKASIKKSTEDLIHVICNTNREVFQRSQESIAITEQSCVIEIVTDKTSETIALRRTIATDTMDCLYQSKLLPIASETNSYKLPVLTKSESSITKLMLNVEHEESKDIFLYDINEPSTSKGIRHVSMDVQCGPDIGFICPVSSATTSLNQIPINVACYNITEFESDINISDQQNVHTMPGKDTTTDNAIGCRLKSNGIQIKDSDNELQTKLDNSTMTINFTPTNVCEDTKIGATSLDEESNTMQLDLFSPFGQNVVCDSNEDKQVYLESPYKSLDYVKLYPNIIEANNTKRILTTEVDLKNNIRVYKHSERKLTYGGVFIHSYKDKKMASEDIMYQGKWQCFLPKTLAKKNPLTMINLRRTSVQYHKNGRNSKENVTQKTLAKTKIKTECNRKFRQKPDIKKINKDENDSRTRNQLIESRKPIKCRNKTLKKVASKMISLDVAKSTKYAEYLQTCKRAFPTENKLRKGKKDALEIDKKYGKNKPSIKTKTINIKKELLKFIPDPHKEIIYSVYRNKIENETDSNRQSLPIKEITRNNTEFKTARNMQSANSSSSSTHSVTTIRHLSPPSQTKRKLTTSKITLKTNNVSKTSSTKIKRSTSECSKKTSVLFDDKENDPHSSNFNTNNVSFNKDSPQDIGNSRSILIPRNGISKHKNKSSNMSIRKPIEIVEKKFSTSGSCSPQILSLADPTQNITKKQIHFNSNSSNLVLVLGSYNKPQPLIDGEKHSSHSSLHENNQEDVSEFSNTTELQYLDKENNAINNLPDICHDIVTIIEESLNFITDNSSTSSQSKKLIHGERNKNYEKVRFNKSFENESEDNSYDSEPKQGNADLISFKSFASLSGYSEYFSADNELSATIDSIHIMTPPKRSVQDLFERNDQPRLSYSGGAAQGFSGFSVNERIIGDQPDYCNLIDSETGTGVEARRATSEEVFTSGRSSDTYVSCHVDDDALVPHWLFQAMNQQRTEEDMEPQQILLPLPIVEPDLDINGNIMETGVGGVAVGAGDGRGIHSDQESSGRDTSMSSTETSSGQQSEAILIDSEAYANNIEFLREPSSRPFLQLGSTESPDSSFRTVEGSENDHVFNMSEGSTRNTLNLGMIQSDRDADVSSLDTDIADFSDN